jgi:phage tail sheath protein FI
MQARARPPVQETEALETGSCVAGGALAGLLCKLDRTRGPWQGLNAPGLGLKPPMKPRLDIDDEDVYALTRAGINPLVRGPAGRARVAGSVTMARGSESHRVFTSLPVRRLCLNVINTIDRATRWAVFEKPDRKLTARLRGQILTYLSCLHELGGLESDGFVVQCDAGLTSREDHLQHGVTILLIFHPAGSREPVSFTLQQTALGCRAFSTAFAPART